MSDFVKDALVKLEAGQNALIEASRAMQQQIDTANSLLERLVQLVTPSTEPQDGPSLDELLAHMIAQQTAIIQLSKQTLTSVTHIEAALPQGARDEKAVSSGRN